MGDEPGFGKTLQSIAAAHVISILLKEQKRPHSVLAVCPKSLEQQWKLELEWYNKSLQNVGNFSMYFYIVLSFICKTTIILGFDISTHHGLEKHFQKDYGIIIFDEAQHLGGKDTQIRSAAFALKAQYK